MPDITNNSFPFVVMPSPRTHEEASAIGDRNWRSFKEAVMGFNSLEAADAASKINKFLSSRLLGLTAGLVKFQRVPELLDNFAYALVENEKSEVRVDPLKVKCVVDMVLNTPFDGLAVISKKMAARIEFQPEAMAMPKYAEGIFSKAFVDATVGSGRGFNWGCFKLRHAFQTPNASLLDVNEALDLHDELSAIPDLVVDEFGEAGIDVAIQMNRHLAIVQNMPVHGM